MKSPSEKEVEKVTVSFSGRNRDALGGNLLESCRILMLQALEAGRGALESKEFVVRDCR